MFIFQHLIILSSLAAALALAHADPNYYGGFGRPLGAFGPGPLPFAGPGFGAPGFEAAPFGGGFRGSLGGIGTYGRAPGFGAFGPGPVPFGGPGLGAPGFEAAPFGGGFRGPLGGFGAYGRAPGLGAFGPGPIPFGGPGLGAPGFEVPPIGGGFRGPFGGIGAYGRAPGLGFDGYGAGPFAPPNYQFGYGVQDPFGAASFGQNEQRTPYGTIGSYNVNTPGSFQSVNYNVAGAGIPAFGAGVPPY